MSPSTLLSRIEDAGLNASAPPQQRWIDGWLVRFSAGKAKRARCVNAVAEGRLPLADKLALAQAVFDDAGLPMVLRITPFTQPASLDARLDAAGFQPIDDTRVMVSPDLGSLRALPLPDGLCWAPVDSAAFAHAVGALRGSPAGQREAHAERLRLSPVPYRAWAIRREDDGAVVACGQYAREAELVGLYDVFTDPAYRARGLAAILCSRLLAAARAQGARTAYLQVDADNGPARRVYHRLGFTDGYAYHYRVRGGSG
ncbi:GNAT family N-acetyltransferase [Aquincola sp. MAHUQ-54]|uniref:GNAT family N-acetyltransferase n=1 Tax=Aquincola agrisoli TaxID=3119538 RepID=A0AAW9QMD3_9BURK